MYKHILVSTDGSKLSAKAVTHAIALAQALGAKLTVFHASPEHCPTPSYAEIAYIPMSSKDYAAFCKKEADKILTQISLKAEAAGLEFSTVHAMAAEPWEGILAAARRNKCDAIVMASHGRHGVSALVLASETQKVLTHSKLPVIVVR